jgi:hypothetical protein
VGSVDGLPNKGPPKLSAKAGNGDVFGVMFLVGDIAVKSPLLLGSRLKNLVPYFLLALLAFADVVFLPESIP